MTPEERSEIGRKRWVNKTPEQRSEIRKKAAETLGPERRSEIMVKANASRTREQVVAAHAKRLETIGEEGRKLMGQKTWRTRRGKKFAQWCNHYFDFDCVIDFRDHDLITALGAEVDDYILGT